MSSLYSLSLPILLWFLNAAFMSRFSIFGLCAFSALVAAVRSMWKLCLMSFDSEVFLAILLSKVSGMASGFSAYCVRSWSIRVISLGL